MSDIVLLAFGFVAGFVLAAVTLWLGLVAGLVLMGERTMRQRITPAILRGKVGSPTYRDDLYTELDEANRDDRAPYDPNATAPRY